MSSSRTRSRVLPSKFLPFHCSGSVLPGTSASAAWAQPGPMRRNWNTVVCFSCGGQRRWAETMLRSGAGQETPTDPGYGVNHPDQ